MGRGWRLSTGIWGTQQQHTAKPEHQALEKVPAAPLCNDTFSVCPVPPQSLIPPFRLLFTSAYSAEPCSFTQKPIYCSFSKQREGFKHHHHPPNLQLLSMQYRFLRDKFGPILRFTGIVLYWYWCERTKDEVFVSTALKAHREVPGTDLHHSTICFG